MDNSLWITLLLASIGTLLLRLLPLLWMQRHLLKQKRKDDLTIIPHWLSVLGPLMIAAMLGVSLVPSSVSASAWWATGLGSLAALFAWLWTKSLGWPVLAGVSMYGAVIVVATKVT